MFRVTPSIHSHLFPFIPIHFHSSFYSFLFPIRFPVTDSYTLILVPSGLSFYASALVHIMCPSSRPFRISLVHDRYIVASLFRLCTPLVLYFCIFPVVLFNSLFRQLYSLLVSLVWDNLNMPCSSNLLFLHFPFTQSLLLQAHSSFQGVAQVFSCRNSPKNKIFLCSQDLWTLDFLIRWPDFPFP